MLKEAAQENRLKLDKQIKALKYLLRTDNPKDKAIHLQAIKDLRKPLMK